MDIKELARQYINDVYNLEFDKGFISKKQLFELLCEHQLRLKQHVTLGMLRNAELKMYSFGMINLDIQKGKEKAAEAVADLCIADATEVYGIIAKGFGYATLKEVIDEKHLTSSIEELNLNVHFEISDNKIYFVTQNEYMYPLYIYDFLNDLIPYISDGLYACIHDDKTEEFLEFYSGEIHSVGYDDEKKELSIAVEDDGSWEYINLTKLGVDRSASAAKRETLYIKNPGEYYLCLQGYKDVNNVENTYRTINGNGIFVISEAEAVKWLKANDTHKI